MCTGQHVPKNTEMSLCLSGARGFCEEKGPFFLFPWEGRLQRIKACLDNSEIKNKETKNSNFITMIPYNELCSCVSSAQLW